MFVCAPRVRVRAPSRARMLHRYADVCISKAWLSLRGGETLTTAWKTSLNRFDGIEGNIFSDGNHRSFRCRRALWGKRRRCERIADAKSWREQLVTRGDTRKRRSRRWEKTVEGIPRLVATRDGVNNSRRFLEVVDEVLDERWTWKGVLVMNG